MLHCVFSNRLDKTGKRETWRYSDNGSLSRKEYPQSKMVDPYIEAYQSFLFGQSKLKAYHRDSGSPFQSDHPLPKSGRYHFYLRRCVGSYHALWSAHRQYA